MVLLSFRYKYSVYTLLRRNTKMESLKSFLIRPLTKTITISKKLLFAVAYIDIPNIAY
jgi:hypothetical protein